MDVNTHFGEEGWIKVDKDGSGMDEVREMKVMILCGRANTSRLVRL